MSVTFTVLASALALITPPKHDSAFDRLIGCWSRGPGSHERWIRGDRNTLLGAGWVNRSGNIEVILMRLSFDGEEAALDIVTLPGKVSSARVNPARMLDERSADSCEARQYAGVRVPAELERVHNADMAAVMRSDGGALIDLWTDDIVSLQPGMLPKAGKRANGDFLIQSLQTNRTRVEPLDYRLEFERTVFVGHYAIEWGRYEGKARIIATRQEVSYAGPMVRVVERKRNGSYRIAATAFALTN